jgi:hypothetical protein
MFLKDGLTAAYYYCYTKRTFMEPSWDFFIVFDWKSWSALGVVMISLNIFYMNPLWTLEFISILLYQGCSEKKRKGLVATLLFALLIFTYHYEAEITGEADRCI